MVVYNRDLFADGDPNSFESVNDYKRASYWMKFGSETKINCISLSEAIAKGQQVIRGKLVLVQGTKTLKEIPFTTIGRKRILTFPTESVSAIRIIIQEAKDTPSLSEVGIYHIPEKLVER